MVKMGLLGVGHLGKIHLKCLQSIPYIDLIGFYDPNETTASAIAATNPTLRRFTSSSDLITYSEAVDIVAPTATHFDLAKQAIQQGKHVFIEKPLTQTLKEAADLVQLAQNNNIKIQIGYVERFNPAFMAIQQKTLNPLFIEAHRLALFNPRGTDVSVVLDLMIHDLDLVLQLIKSPLSSVQASGVAVLSKSPDIANARLEFSNGAVANLTASRMSIKQMRKLRLFQKDVYMSLDLLEKKTQIIQLSEENSVKNGNLLSLDTEEGKKYISLENLKPTSTNAIKMELEAFVASILDDTTPVVTLEEGYQTLKVAHQIIQKIEERTSIITI